VIASNDTVIGATRPCPGGQYRAPERINQCWRCHRRVDCSRSLCIVCVHQICRLQSFRVVSRRSRALRNRSQRRIPTSASATTRIARASRPGPPETRGPTPHIRSLRSSYLGRRIIWVGRGRPATVRGGNRRSRQRRREYDLQPRQ